MACTARRRRAYRGLVRKRYGKPTPELAVDGRIIFSSILDRSGGGRWTGLTWLGIGTSSELLTSRETIGFSGLCSMKLSLLAYTVLNERSGCDG